ncbi:MAG: hypothetical protein AAFW47_05625 [Pseudomonadota bacterium]
MKNLFFVFAIGLALFALPAQASSDKGALFARADVDQSASLDRSEFRQFINLLAKAGNTGAKRVRALRLYGLAWLRVDKNGDGVATRAELFSARMASLKKSPSRLTLVQ